LVQNVLLLALGGVFGTLTRYALGLLFAARFGTAFPYGTLVINVTGCFVIGLVGTLAAERMWVTPELRLLIGVGFCGAFTTFSSFGYETVLLVRMGALAQAGFYVLASNALGLLAVFLGVKLAGLMV
jgi:CrcB protein